MRHDTWMRAAALAWLPFMLTGMVSTRAWGDCKLTCDPGWKGKDGCCPYSTPAHRDIHVPTERADCHGTTECQKRCAKDDERACVGLGRILRDGPDARPSDASTLFEKACDAGEPRGCFELAVATKPQWKAVALDEQACAGGYAPACEEAAHAYHFAPADPSFHTDDKKAGALAEMACRGGILDGCALHAAIANDTGELEKICAKHDAFACNALAEAAEQAHGAPAPTAKLYESACEYDESGFDCMRAAGFAADEKPPDRKLVLLAVEQACRHPFQWCSLLAGDLLTGTDLPRDPAAATRILAGACHRGNAMACQALGTAYRSGTGVARDAKQAGALLDRACSIAHEACIFAAQAAHERHDDDHALALARKGCDSTGDACALAGNLYAQGANYVAAAELFEEGCNARDDASCCQELGKLYRTGSGVAKDDQKANALFQRACQLGTCDSPLPSCSAHWTKRSDQGGTIELDRNDPTAEDVANREMAAHCGTDNFVIMEEEPARSDRGKVLHYGCNVPAQVKAEPDTQALGCDPGAVRGDAAP